MAKDTKQLGEPAGPAGYVENMNKLAYYCHGVALNQPDAMKNIEDKVTNGDNLWRQVTHFVPSSGFSATMAGRYLKKFGEKNALTGPVNDETHLALALFLWTRVKGRWGPTKQDAWKSLCCWLYYGPDARPSDMPRNWAALCNWPPIEKVEVDLSKTVEEITAALPTLSRLEKIKVVRAYTESLRLDIEYELMGVGPAPEPEPEPELPCEDGKPFPLFLLFGLGRRQPNTPQERAEIVAELSQLSALDEPRCRELLCGEVPYEHEIPNLAAAIRLTPEQLTTYLTTIQVLPLVAAEES